MSEPLNLDLLVTNIREAAGKDLDRIILHGSYAWGNWNPETSDIDIAVLTRGCDDGRCFEIRSAIRQANRRSGDLMGRAADRIELTVRPAADYRSLVEFEPCAESKTLRLGKVLWGANEASCNALLTRDEAKRVVVNRGLRAAANNITRSRIWVHRGISSYDGLFDERACVDSYAAACLALRAFLYAHDVDPSPKDLRWSIPRLCDKLALPAPDHLPERYYPEVDAPVTRGEARKAVAAAARIYRLGRRMFDCGEPLADQGAIIDQVRKLSTHEPRYRPNRNI